MSDIAELFARNPLQLTTTDLEEIVKKFRESRGQFVVGNMKAGSTKPLTEKQKITGGLATNFTLEL